MRKILAMLLSVMLLLTAAVAETPAPYAPETVLPLVSNNRPYRDFTRSAISSSEDAIEQAKAWLYLPLFVTNFSAKAEAVDWSAMRAGEGWYVTAYMRNTFVWLLMDEQGRVQAYDFDLLGNASLTYDGALPDNLDEAISSYIRRFADLNGFVEVADYAREEVTTFGDYAVAVTVQVMLDGTPYRFTMRLDMMAFTSVENANLHPTAAQTQRDILLLMRDNLAEKGVDITQTFFAVQADDADGETKLTALPPSRRTRRATRFANSTANWDATRCITAGARRKRASSAWSCPTGRKQRQLRNSLWRCMRWWMANIWCRTANWRLAQRILRWTAWVCVVET